MYRLCKITSYAHIREGSNLKECMTSKLHKVQFLSMLISTNFHYTLFEIYCTQVCRNMHVYLSNRSSTFKTSREKIIYYFSCMINVTSYECSVKSTHTDIHIKLFRSICVSETGPAFIIRFLVWLDTQPKQTK